MKRHYRYPILVTSFLLNAVTIAGASFDTTGHYYDRLAFILQGENSPLGRLIFQSTATVIVSAVNITAFTYGLNSFLKKREPFTDLTGCWRGAFVLLSALMALSVGVNGFFAYQSGVTLAALGKLPIFACKLFSFILSGVYGLNYLAYFYWGAIQGASKRLYDLSRTESNQLDEEALITRGESLSLFRVVSRPEVVALLLLNIAYYSFFLVQIFPVRWQQVLAIVVTSVSMVLLKLFSVGEHFKGNTWEQARFYQNGHGKIQHDQPVSRFVMACGLLEALIGWQGAFTLCLDGVVMNFVGEDAALVWHRASFIAASVLSVFAMRPYFEFNVSGYFYSATKRMQYGG